MKLILNWTSPTHDLLIVLASYSYAIFKKKYVNTRFMKTKIVHRKLNCLFWKKVHVCHNMERCHTQLYNRSVLMSQYGLVQSVIIHLGTTGTDSCFSWYCEILHFKAYMYILLITFRVEWYLEILTLIN